MPRLTKYARSRAVLLRSKGFTVKKIHCSSTVVRLKEDGVTVSSRSLFELFAKGIKELES